MNTKHQHEYAEWIWTCSMEKSLSIDMDKQNGHEHEAWTFRMNIQHGPAVQTCIMDIQHENAAEMKHRYVEWTCSIDMQNDMQQRKAAWKIGHTAWTCKMDMPHEQAA
jgi:hypothetical protein